MTEQGPQKERGVTKKQVQLETTKKKVGLEIHDPKDVLKGYGLEERAYNYGYTTSQKCFERFD